MATFKEYFNDYIVESKYSKSNEPVTPKDIKHFRRLVKSKKIPLDKIDLDSIPEAEPGFHDFSILFRGTERTDFSGLETWDVSRVMNFGQMFSGLSTFTGKEIEGWDVIRGRWFNYMFSGCVKFNADLSKWKFSKYLEYQAFNYMFSGCKSFTGKGLEKWKFDDGSVEQLLYMFEDCESFTGKTIEKWDVSDIKATKGTFKGCTNFNADLSHWDVSKVEKMDEMFEGCKSFTGKGLEKWDLSSLKSCENIFKGSGIKNIPENFAKKFKELGLSPDGE